MDENEEWSDIWEVDSGVHKGWNHQEISALVKSFRFVGSQQGSCRVGQVEVKGIDVYDSEEEEVSCAPKITIGGQSMEVDGLVTYRASLTPYLTSISPRLGSVLGGDVVSFSGGWNWTGDQGVEDVTIDIDGRSCKVQVFTADVIKCQTSDRPFSSWPDDPDLKVYIEGQGNMANQGHVFRYVQRWSDTQTWGGFAPVEGDAVNIPKGMHLLVDVPSTPVLSFVLVEGSLIFDASAKAFDAGQIIVKHGYMEVGTEDEPFTGQLTISMHGEEFSPHLSIFGNKVIAVHGGNLEMHG